MRWLISVFCLSASAVPALEIKHIATYDLNQPASLDYDPTFCGLWIANEGPELTLVTLEGDELRRFGSELSRIKAITIEGDNLLVADGYGRFQRLTKNGDPLGPVFRTSHDFTDTEGLAIAEDGTILSVEDDPERLSWISPDGTVERDVNTMTFDPPLSEPQGIARDPRNGHLLIVDDWEGTNSLYELDENGAFLGSVPLHEFGIDPEGIAIRPGSNQIFIGFDQGAKISSFDYTPTLAPGETLPDPGADCMMF